MTPLWSGQDRPKPASLITEKAHVHYAESTIIDIDAGCRVFYMPDGGWGLGAGGRGLGLGA